MFHIKVIKKINKNQLEYIVKYENWLDDEFKKNLILKIIYIIIIKIIIIKYYLIIINN